jgi:hypothetical protein
MLSKVNSDKLVASGLYEHDPIDDRFTETSGNFHCKNWTFIIKEGKGGQWWAIDTYFDSWDSHRMEVTDDNFHEFRFMVDLTAIEEARRDSALIYKEENRYCLAIDSGGIHYPKWFIKKGSKKSKTIQRQEYIDRLANAKRSVVSAEWDLKRIDEDPDGYFAKYYED